MAQVVRVIDAETLKRRKQQARDARKSDKLTHNPFKLALANVKPSK